MLKKKKMEQGNEWDILFCCLLPINSAKISLALPEARRISHCISTSAGTPGAPLRSRRSFLYARPTTFYKLLRQMRKAHLHVDHCCTVKRIGCRETEGRVRHRFACQTGLVARPSVLQPPNYEHDTYARSHSARASSRSPLYKWNKSNQNANHLEFHFRGCARPSPRAQTLFLQPFRGRETGRQESHLAAGSMRENCAAGRKQNERDEAVRGAWLGIFGPFRGSLCGCT